MEAAADTFDFVSFSYLVLKVLIRNPCTFSDLWQEYGGMCPSPAFLTRFFDGRGDKEFK